LTNFFDQKDPHKTFCQLEKFTDTNGHFKWTTKENNKKREENNKKMKSETDDDNGDIQTDARTLTMESSTVRPGYGAIMSGQSNETLQDGTSEQDCEAHKVDTDVAPIDNSVDVMCCFLFCSSCNQMWCICCP